MKGKKFIVRNKVVLFFFVEEARYTLLSEEEHKRYIVYNFGRILSHLLPVSGL